MNFSLFQVARILKVCTGQIELTTVRPQVNVQTESIVQSKPDDVSARLPMGTHDSSRHSSMENLGKSREIRTCLQSQTMSCDCTQANDILYLLIMNIQSK